MEQPRIFRYDTVDSTNTVCKSLAAQGAPSGTAVIARRQTAGRGRMGRSFESPEGLGLYLSVLWRPEGTPEDLLPLTAGGLTEACSARFTRLAKQIVLERCTVELALDEGTLMGGGRTLPFAEMEVELKSGEEAAATAFAEALAQEFNLTPEPKSKAQRAMALLH